MFVAVRCAAHTLHLAVLDAFKSTEMEDIMDKVRSVVKKLRTAACANILRSHNSPKFFLDCPTR